MRLPLDAHPPDLDDPDEDEDPEYDEDNEDDEDDEDEDEDDEDEETWQVCPSPAATIASRLDFPPQTA
jgi:hypothetical protein